MWLELNRVFQAYEQLDPREQIHRRICANFQHDRQISDPGGFRRELRGLLLEREPPLSGSERNGTGSRSAQDTRAPPASSSRTREPPSSPGVTASSPKVHVPSSGTAQSPGGPAPSPGGPAPSPGVPKPTLGDASPSPGGLAPPSRDIEPPPSRTKRPVWHRLFPCLAPSLQHS